MVHSNYCNIWIAFTWSLSHGFFFYQSNPNKPTGWRNKEILKNELKWHVFLHIALLHNDHTSIVECIPLIFSRTNNTQHSKEMPFNLDR